MANVKRVLARRLKFPTFLKRTKRPVSPSVAIFTLSLISILAVIWFASPALRGLELIAVFAVAFGLSLFQRYTASVLKSQRDWGITILDAINEGIVTTDEKGKITFMNSEAEVLTGYRTASTIGEPLNTILVLRHAATGRIVIQKGHLVARHTTEPSEAFLTRRNGKQLPVAHHAAPIKNSAGAVIGSIRILRNISRRLANEAEIEKRKRAFETLVENAGDIITRHDTNYRYIYVNRETERITGKPRREFLGKTFKDVINNKIAVATLTEGLRNVYTNRKTYTTEYRTLTSEGLRYFHSRFVPEFDKTRELTSVLIISRDITELKLISERKDEFIAMASHELKTPLTSVKILVQLLERRFKDDGLAARYFTVVNRQLDTITHFINDMLDVTKIQAGKLTLHKEWFPLADLIDQTTLVIRAISPSHRLKVINRAKIKTFYGDGERLGQVLTNLLTNAVKYSPNAPNIVMNIESDERSLMISVRDAGIGIAKTELTKIFERFYRIYGNNERIPGLGMGLYISFEIVKRHDGDMWVESDIGRGSTFFISLPIVHP